MKSVFVAGLVIGLFTSVTTFAQDAKSVILTGSTRNFNNQVEVQDMSEMGDLTLPDPQRFFVPDADGKFKVKFRLAAPNYFRVGRNILYLSPGDSLTVFIDYKDSKLATFSGNHSAENEYLRETPFPKGGSFLEAGTNIKSTTDSTVMIIEGIALRRTKSLAAYSGLSKEFVKLETGRIKADIINSIKAIGAYYPMRKRMNKASSDSFHTVFEEESKPYLQRYDQHFIDPDLLKLVVYRDIVDDLVAEEKANTKELQQVKDWMAARDMSQQLKRASDRETKMKFQSSIAAISNTSYRNAMSNTLNKVLQLSNGDMAFDFAALSIENKATKLADLKGKLIYVDLWATWCGPCMEEMPAYEKLKESFKDNPNINFISLSIDDDKDAWRASVKKRNAQGLQWLVDRAKLQPYNIMSVPRSILIDKDFHVVEMNAALPSSKTIVNMINSLAK